jgi:hypothetical protein
MADRCGRRLDPGSRKSRPPLSSVPLASRHRIDVPCHLELVVGLLVYFKGDVEVPNGDKVA